MGARRRGALALGLVLALGACSTDREITRPEPEPVTTQALAATRLTVDDLPDGFVAVDAGVTAATELLPEHECDDALGDLAPAEEASTTFERGSTTLSSTVAHFPGQGGAVDQLLRDVAEDCAAVVAGDAGVSIRTGALDFGVLSDDTLPIRVEVEPRTGAIEERDLIVVRAGDLVHLVRLTGPRPSDKALLDSVVRTAIGRLGELHLRTT